MKGVSTHNIFDRSFSDSQSMSNDYSIDYYLNYTSLPSKHLLSRWTPTPTKYLEPEDRPRSSTKLHKWRQPNLPLSSRANEKCTVSWLRRSMSTSHHLRMWPSGIWRISSLVRKRELRVTKSNTSMYPNSRDWPSKICKHMLLLFLPSQAISQSRRKLKNCPDSISPM